MEQLTVVRGCLQMLPIESVLIERMLSCTTAFERMSPARTDALEDHIDSNGQTVEDKTIDQVPGRHNGVNLLNLLGCLMKYFRQSRYSREVDVCCERGEHSCIHGERHDKPLVLAREDGIGWLILMLLLFLRFPTDRLVLCTDGGHRNDIPLVRWNCRNDRCLPYLARWISR